MRIERADPSAAKGWFAGPGESGLAISVGYANCGIDEPHLHRQITEVYLVASGSCQIRVERETITLQPGDLIVVEPGEAHTFLSSSSSYFHYVIHTPRLPVEQARADKQLVSRARLGLE